MYAVIKTGGKQYRVIEGQTLDIESVTANPGDQFDFNEVLMVSNGDSIQVGKPFVSGVSVKAEVLHHGRADKIEIIKFRRRKHSMKHQGHRQNFTQVKIVSIQQ